MIAIVNDPVNGRVLDTDTGDYMTFSLFNREPEELYFIIHDVSDRPIFGSIVRRQGIDESGTAGGSTLVRFILKRAWIPSGQSEKPVYFNGEHSLIDRLRSFLEVYKYYYGVKSPDPRFEFVDGR